MNQGDLLARRYQILTPIASGGMSQVWRAFDLSLHRFVAVKVLAGACRSDRDPIRREAQTVARLVHPDVIEVYDYGETVAPDGRLAAYVVMRLLEGESLADRIDRGPLPWREAAVVGVRLARVLAAAHAGGIVHRDLTPGNVMLTSEGAKVLDFGIAAQIGEPQEEVAGTPPYVAPECLTGVPADPAADVYALGVVLYEMLTGRLPYPERTWDELERVRERPVPRLPWTLPRRLARICRACLAGDPAARPAARQVADVLAACLERRHRPLPLTAVAAAAAMAATVSALLPPAEGPPPASHEAGRRTAAATPPASPTTPASTTPDAPARGTATTSPEPIMAPLGTPVTRRGVASEPAYAAASLEEAAGAFEAVLAEAEAQGRVRQDVALDLRQVLRNLIASGERDLSPLRAKLRDRRREGAIGPEAAAALDRLVAAMQVLAADESFNTGP
ncbi:serine/threonine-protein kinase [Thermoactinospora rubra]|uniref:serine/threonine-protein kinase n=1 Tax=Thermoactinospora rubra TaxID=1088767 RepID=UPI00117F4F74|nr:serine/threonine-protein kinase [Thermoactinospora rubra]